MADYDESVEDLSRPRVVAGLLAVGAVLLALIAGVWALAQLWGLSRLPAGTFPGPTAGFPGVMGVLLALLLAWGLSLLLWGAAEFLRRLTDLSETVGRGLGALAGGGLGGPVRGRLADADHHGQMLEELVQLTRELRDIELLSEADRAIRQKAEAEELVRALEREVPALLREHNLQEAALRVARARQRFPSLPNWAGLMQQVEQARAKLEAHDSAAATREVDDLVALGAFDRAVEAVRHFRARHPNSEIVGELARRIATARERASAAERAKLMSQAQDATNRKQWAEALRLVETLLAKFPGSPEAEELRRQVPVIRDNVEIHKRQEMEAQIRELVRLQRFREALRVANELITNYPDSPQAAVLRDQLPRLEQRAAEAAA